MRTVGISDITEDLFKEESLLTVDMLRTAYPKLDLRRGTVLRDLLVNPDGALSAVMRRQVDECRRSMSLKALSDAEESGETIDQDDVRAALSNFNVEPTTGTRAKGTVRIVVSAGNRMYKVQRGSRFSSIDGVMFEAVSTVEAAPTPTGDQEKLHPGKDDKDNRWFLVPVEAVDVGVNGNLAQGTEINSEFSMYGFVSAMAYDTFSGGSDLEPLKSTVARIKASLSMRGLTSAPAIEASLRDEFDQSENPLVAVSVCGYGNDAQLRDKHNLFGVGVGGRSDVYIRNFTSIPTESVTKEAEERVVGDETVYVVHVSHEEVPGMYCVYGVSDADTKSLSSYRHSDVWTSGGLGSTWHDIDDGNFHRETAGTVWRDVEITVYDVDPPDTGPVMLKVELVRLPDASAIQSHLDDGFVRNVGSDVVARCPVVVQMSVSAFVRHDPGVAFDTSEAVSRICDYVNTSGFSRRITRSEISSILIGCGARSVDLFDESRMLYGFGYGADGSMFELSGDALDVSAARNPANMVTEDTCVFCVEPRNIQIKVVSL